MTTCALPWTLFINEALMNNNTIKIYEDINTVRDNSSLSVKKSELSSYLENCYYEASTHNWDGYNANPINSFSYSQALKFINNIPNEIISPEISVDTLGEVNFEWYNQKNRYTFAISFSSQGYINFAGLYGKNLKINGTIRFDGVIPDTIVSFIDQVFTF